MLFDFKLEIWGRIDVTKFINNNEEDAIEIINLAKEKTTAGDLTTANEVFDFFIDHGLNVDFGYIESTEEMLSPRENNMEATIDIVEETQDGEQTLWSNQVPTKGEITSVEGFVDQVLQEFHGGDLTQFVEKLAKKAYNSGMIDTSDLKYNERSDAKAVLIAALMDYASQIPQPTQIKEQVKNIRYL